MSTQKKGRTATPPYAAAAQKVGSNTDTTKDNLQLEDELVNGILEMPFQELMITLGIDAEKLESSIRRVTKRKLTEKRGL